MNDKLDEQAERIIPSWQVSFPGIPEAEQLVRESDEHADEAVVHYRRALESEGLGRPALRDLLHTIIAQNAAAFAQGRAQLILLAEMLGADMETQEAKEVTPS